MTPAEAGFMLIAMDPTIFYRNMIVAAAKYECEPTEDHYNEVMWLSQTLHKMYALRNHLTNTIRQ